MLEWILAIVLLIVNFAISCWNAYTVGSSKGYANGLGVWTKILLYSGWIMSAAGFTWVYMFLLGIAAYSMGYLDEVALKVTFELGYLVIIFPVLGTGIIITLQSWINAWKRRSTVDVGVAVWNTSAQAYNSFRAISAIPEALGDVIKFFAESGGSSRGRGKGAGGVIVVVIVLLALFGGILTTHLIVRWASERAE
jgi:hypothetical protein